MRMAAWLLLLRLRRVLPLKPAGKKKGASSSETPGWNRQTEARYRSAQFAVKESGHQCGIERFCDYHGAEGQSCQAADRQHGYACQTGHASHPPAGRGLSGNSGFGEKVV